MKRWEPRAIAVLLALVTALLATGPALAQPAPGGDYMGFTNDYFAHTWERTDKPIKHNRASRTWVWGPEKYTSGMWEDYAESPDGRRRVQYFDKSRMELTHPEGDPNSVWYVTNGLLVNELISGRMQVGDTAFEQQAPAQINVAGDLDDPDGVTYADLAAILGQPATDVGAPLVQRLGGDGDISTDPALGAYGVSAAYRVSVPGIDHSVASPFWEFMNSTGVVYTPGHYFVDKLFLDPFYATGLPVTEAYWVNVNVAGQKHEVLLQCFERRCLTYTPANDPGWQVEFGNVGQHYYHWRYDR